MASINFNADMKIKVVYPQLTKKMSGSDKSQLGQTGTFKYEPRPQVETAQASNTEVNFSPSTPQKERFNKLGVDLDDLISQAEKIEAAFRKRAADVVVEYDALDIANESISDAEATIFGVASGKITYAMYESMLEFEDKINKWISHQSIINDGKLNSV